MAKGFIVGLIFGFIGSAFMFAGIVEHWLRVKFKRCIMLSCSARVKASCGSGYCAEHCHYACCDECIDPRSAPVGDPDHKMVLIEGGKK